MSSSSPVSVYIYDLSQGMMTAMSAQLLGKQLNGIWHTSIVVSYDGQPREFFFGGGISSARPGTTSAGRPLRTMDFGTTEVPKEMFYEYLHSLHDRFNINTYHLLRNNCNHFTNEVLNFLTGKSLPDYIINLPNEFLSTPLGTMMAPMIDQMFQRLGGDGAPV